MRERAKGLGLGAIALIAALALPASANAASLNYAAPTPIGAANCSSPANACTIYSAVTAATMPGDQVLLAGGSYSLNTGGSLVIGQAITIKPQVAGTRPLLTSTNGNNVLVPMAGAGATIQDLEIDVSGIAAGGRALDFQAAGTALRVEVVATGASPIGVLVKNGALLSDSTVRTASAAGNAINTGGTGGTIRNVTAISGSGDGLASFSAFGAPQVVNVHNSILRGGLTDIHALGAAMNDITVNVDHSNFVTSIPPPASPNAVINDMGGNQNSAPLFANAAMGDFTQLAGSPTIDKGAAVGGLGPLDFSAGPRVLGLAPDIGTDEFPSAGPSQFPNATTPTATTKKTKCKKKKKKKSKSAVASKKCKKKKKK